MEAMELDCDRQILLQLGNKGSVSHDRCYFISKTGKSRPYKTLHTLHQTRIYMVWSRYLLFLHTRMGQFPAKLVNFANLANLVNVRHFYLSS